MMPSDWYVGILCVAMGIAIACLWVALLVTRQVPEIGAHDEAIYYHLSAELALAGGLLAAGIATIGRASFAVPLSAAALGGLLYSCVNSAGFYAKRGQRLMVAMFGVVVVLAFCGLVTLLR